MPKFPPPPRIAQNRSVVFFNVGKTVFNRNRGKSPFVKNVRFSQCLQDEAQLLSLCSEIPMVKWNCLPTPNQTMREVLPAANSFDAWRLFRLV